MKRFLVLLGTLMAWPLHGAVSTGNFTAKVNDLEARFPLQLKVFVSAEGGDMEFCPIGINQVRGQQSSIARGGVYLIEGTFYAPLSAELVLTQPDGTLAKQVAVPPGTADFAVVVRVKDIGRLHLVCRSRDGAMTYGGVYVSSSLPHWWNRHYVGDGVYYDKGQMDSTRTIRVALEEGNWSRLDYTGPADSAGSVANTFTPSGPAGLVYAAPNPCTVMTTCGKK